MILQCQNTQNDILKSNNKQEIKNKTELKTEASITDYKNL